MLERAGLDADALRNPPGWPLDAEAMAASQHKHKLLHNCSGKHAGMLLACVRAGWDPATYLRASHPLQRRVTRAVHRATGLEDLTMSVDGCGVPVHGMPLRSMATLFARLTATERLGDLAPAADRVDRGDALRALPGRRPQPRGHGPHADDAGRRGEVRRGGPGMRGRAARPVWASR